MRSASIFDTFLLSGRSHPPWQPRTYTQASSLQRLAIGTILPALIPTPSAGITLSSWRPTSLNLTTLPTTLHQPMLCGWSMLWLKREFRPRYCNVIKGQEGGACRLRSSIQCQTMFRGWGCRRHHGTTDPLPRRETSPARILPAQIGFRKYFTRSDPRSMSPWD